MNDFQNSEQIKKVYEYIHENYYRKIGLEEISQLVNMSPVSFNRFIKKRTGKTFINYVNDTRISYASRLLIESEKSIGEISYQCGFNNIANFNRIFKKSHSIRFQPHNRFQSIFWYNFKIYCEYLCIE